MNANLQKTAPKIAKLFQNGGSQAVRLPKEYRFEAESVEIVREGEKLIISPVKERLSWAEFFELERPDGDGLMEGVENLPLQERDLFSD